MNSWDGYLTTQAICVLFLDYMRRMSESIGFIPPKPNLLKDDNPI